MTDNRKYKFLDRDHPFFAKTWVRGATVALPAGMAVPRLWHPVCGRRRLGAVGVVPAALNGLSSGCCRAFRRCRL